MDLIVNGEQMRAAEINAEKRGVPAGVLAHNAAYACYKAIGEIVGSFGDKTFTVLCGKGNNGADGVILADFIKKSEGEVLCVFVFDETPPGEPAKGIYQRYAPGLDTAMYARNENPVRAALSNSDVIVDCVFGTGFRGETPPKTAELFRFINSETDALKISVDIPSAGFNSDITLVLGAYKKSVLASDGFSGETKLLDIGLADSDFTEYSARFTGADIADCMPVIPKNAHKGTCGRLLNIAGSERYPGAALLSSKAAVKSGAGLVTVAAPNRVIKAIVPAVPEAVFLAVDTDKDGFITSGAAKQLLPELQKATAAAIGCGLGKTPETRKIVEFVIKTASCPVILDADGINSISDNINVLNENKNLILTPHPAEFGRLTGTDVSEIQKNRIDYAAVFARESGAVVLLKGANTVIAAPDGRVNVNPTGNQSLAKAGTGDVLTGLIASLAARGVKPFEAACLGAYMHGLAADKLSFKKPLYGITANDIAETIGEHLL